LAPSFYSYQVKNHSATAFSTRQLRNPPTPKTKFGKSTMNTTISIACSALVATSAVLWLRQRQFFLAHLKSGRQFHACHEENINPRKPSRLPLLFALDGKLDIPNGFTYVPDCSGFQRKDGNGDGGSDGGSDGGGDGGGSSCGGGGCGGGGD
jgi:uncharacterized membrane protein YgcG